MIATASLKSAALAGGRALVVITPGAVTGASSAWLRGGDAGAAPCTWPPGLTGRIERPGPNLSLRNGRGGTLPLRPNRIQSPLATGRRLAAVPVALGRDGAPKRIDCRGQDWWPRTWRVGRFRPQWLQH